MTEPKSDADRFVRLMNEAGWTVEGVLGVLRATKQADVRSSVQQRTWRPMRLSAGSRDVPQTTHEVYWTSTPGRRSAEGSGG